MKNFFTFFIGLCISVSADAARNITGPDANGVITITTDAEGDLANLTDAEKTILRNNSKWKLVGYFKGDPDFAQLHQAANPTELDLRQAHIAQGTPTYKYYALEEGNNRRHILGGGGNYSPLQPDGDSWYYIDEKNQRVTVQEEDLRIYSVDVSGGFTFVNFSNWKTSLTTLYLPEFSDYQYIPNEFAGEFDALTNLSIPNNIKVIGKQAFKATAQGQGATLQPHGHLSSVNLPNGLIAIGFEAFLAQPLTTVTIPGSVQLIDSYAFGNNNALQTMIFSAASDDPNHHMYIGKQTFNNLKSLQDVYLETSSKFDCENNAFDFRNTYGQGDASTSTFATLHFSSEVAEHYANLKHPLTMAEATDPAKFHKWLMTHFSQANATSHNNGWWEFINTGTTDEEEPLEDKPFLKTYSTYDYDRIVPAGIKAYIVSGFHKAGDGKVSVDLTQIYVIPRRTGVILYGVPNSKTKEGDPTISLQVCEIANGYPLRRDYFKVGTLKNYLWPTSVTYSKGFGDYRIEQFNKYTINASDEITGVTGAVRMVRKEVRKSADTSSEQIYLGPEVLGPWDNVSGVYTSDKPSTATGQETYDAQELEGFYRNFYLNRYCNTASGKAYLKQPNSSVDAAQYVGFFRAIKAPTKPGQAFLRLKDGEFDDPNGGEVIINGDTGTYGTYSGKILKNYQVEFDPKNQGQVWTPTQSGHWYGDAFTPIPTGKPDMTWTNNDNWGDRSRVSAGANFVEVMCYDEPNIIDHGNGTATLIVSVQKEDNQQGDYYNLQGVKVANPTKGIYIQNGKKVVIK